MPLISKRILNKKFMDSDDEIIKWEVLEISHNQRIILRFISTNSENRQGIRIAIDVGEGTLSINGISQKAFELWKDECPSEVEIECISKEGYLSIYNIFEKLSWTGKKERYSLGDFSGMILEKQGNVYRYCCNNATLNSDFDKLVFEIELK